jgi:pimeloyl-ACP methyl ester carboxylesterase
MPRAKANGIDIEYDTFGQSTARPLLLIMGLGSQMVAWPRGFCERLAAKGHFLVRFDNRDTGLSTKMEHAGVPNIFEAVEASQGGRQVSAPYTLSDMARDAVGLMDALELKKAHVCGLSMGGMIAQTVAIEHPHRVLSLISMESAVGEAGLPESTPAARQAMFTAPPAERDAYIQHVTEVFRVFSGGSDKFNESIEGEIAALSYDRSYHPIGFALQLMAILASVSRKQALRSIKVPTLVIHGVQDALLPLQHGIETAETIPGANLLVIEGLGHGLSYPELWDEIVEAISEHTANATQV